METDTIKRGWKEQLEEGKLTDLDDDMKCPDLLEIAKTSAIENIKSRKPKCVEIEPVEMLKSLGFQGKKAVMKVCKQIFITGERTYGFTKAIMIPLLHKHRLHFSCIKHHPKCTYPKD